MESTLCDLFPPQALGKRTEMVRGEEERLGITHDRNHMSFIGVDFIK
jgi:hypothetical protein